MEGNRIRTNSPSACPCKDLLPGDILPFFAVSPLHSPGQLLHHRHVVGEPDSSDHQNTFLLIEEPLELGDIPDSPEIIFRSELDEPFVRSSTLSSRWLSGTYPASAANSNSLFSFFPFISISFWCIVLAHLLKADIDLKRTNLISRRLGDPMSFRIA